MGCGLAAPREARTSAPAAPAAPVHGGSDRLPPTLETAGGQPFYRELLCNGEKALYDTLLEGVRMRATELAADIPSTASMERVNRAVLLDNAWVFYAFVSGYDATNGHLPATLTIHQTGADSARAGAVDGVLAQSFQPYCVQYRLLDRNVPVWTRVATVAHWLVDRVEYDAESRRQWASNLCTDDAFTICGSLLRGKAVCGGIAKAFKLLCDYSEVTCICVHGACDRTAERHMWNALHVDGAWHFCDLTLAVMHRAQLPCRCGHRPTACSTGCHHIVYPRRFLIMTGDEQRSCGYSLDGTHFPVLGSLLERSSDLDTALLRYLELGTMRLGLPCTDDHVSSGAFQDSVLSHATLLACIALRNTVAAGSLGDSIPDSTYHSLSRQLQIAELSETYTHYLQNVPALQSGLLRADTLFVELNLPATPQHNAVARALIRSRGLLVAAVSRYWPCRLLLGRQCHDTVFLVFEKRSHSS